jgi:hypothetical protein
MYRDFCVMSYFVRTLHALYFIELCYLHNTYSRNDGQTVGRYELITYLLTYRFAFVVVFLSAFLCRW